MSWGQAGIFLTAVLAAVRDPRLARERAQVRETAKGGDRSIIQLYNLLTYLVMLPLARLDVRFGWSPPPSVPFQLAALLAFARGMALFDWALISNPFARRLCDCRMTAAIPLRPADPTVTCGIRAMWACWRCS